MDRRQKQDSGNAGSRTKRGSANGNNRGQVAVNDVTRVRGTCLAWLFGYWLLYTEAVRWVATRTKKHKTRRSTHRILSQTLLQQQQACQLDLESPQEVASRARCPTQGHPLPCCYSSFGAQ